MPGKDADNAPLNRRVLCLYLPGLPADRTELGRLADWALRFSPIVEPVEPATLLLDITGCQRLFGGEINIARQALDGLRRQGFHARAAIADTVGAACALATASGEVVVVAPEGQTSAVSSRTVSRGAGRLASHGRQGGRPLLPARKLSAGNGTRQARGLFHSLASLPPAALRIGADVAERLERLGVRTIGDLLRLPRSSLVARFGPQLVRRLQQALGEVYEEVTAHACEQPPAAGISFETPVSDLPVIQAAAAQLLEQLFEQLLQRMLGLRRVDCVLIYEQVGPTVLAVGLSRASRAWRHIGELVQRRLAAADLSAGVVGVRLVASETERFKPGQMELFEPRAPDGEEQFGCLLDRLINRLGPGAVVRAELLADYQPERAFRYVPAYATVARSRERERGAPSSLPRPTQVLSRPLPIRVIALVPDGPPTWFVLRNREYIVGHVWGPERIETGWWRGPDIRRDYFRVSTETGEQFWIFHSPAERQWYLHGVFA